MAVYEFDSGRRESDRGFMNRICTKCREEKPLKDFPPDRRDKKGTQARCRECINRWMKIHYRKNPAWAMWRRAVARAALKGFDCNITFDDLLPLPKKCPVLGISLRASRGPQDPQAYSLDRIENKKGYILGNIIVMSYKANRLKNDGTAQEHEAIARWMRSIKRRKK